MTAEIRNWIADNRNAEQPPAYFLQRLYDFDAMLVLMPSRDQPGAYVLGRRKQFGPGLTPAAVQGVYTKPDTRMCILNGAVPVCMVFKPANGSWSPDPLIRTLMARDIWAHGGADKVADMLEEQEEAEKVATLAASRKEIYERSGDGWRSYLARTGQSSIKFNDRFPVKKQRVAANGEVVAPRKTTGSRRTAGLGSRRKRAGLTIGRRRTKGKGN
jgi:hypothetical protein